MDRWVNTRRPWGTKAMPSFTISWVSAAKGLLTPVDGAGHHGGEAHDGLEDGGLASAVGSHDGDDFAGVDLHGNVVQRADGAVLHRDVGEFQERRVAVGFGW